MMMAIMVFLESYVLFEDPEMNRIFIGRVQSQDKNNIMGTIEYVKMEAEERGHTAGLIEGRTEAKIAVIKNLINTTEFSDDRIAAIASVSVALVEETRQGKK